MFIPPDAKELQFIQIIGERQVPVRDFDQGMGTRTILEQFERMEVFHGTHSLSDFPHHCTSYTRSGCDRSGE